MRQQGKVVSWNDARGFGFVVRNGQAEKLFLHARAFAHPSRRPKVGDVLVWTATDDEQGRLQAKDVEFAGAAAHRARVHAERRRKPWSWFFSALGTAIAIAVVAVAVNRQWPMRMDLINRDPVGFSSSASSSEVASDIATGRDRVSVFTCTTGKQHCSQMQSCAEATFYIEHCPDTKMDGDHDGIPCEDLLCGH